MFSYHPSSESAPVGETFTYDFVAVDVDDISRIANCMRRFAWSQSVFKGGHRKGDNFLYADWIALDFDMPEMSLDAAKKAFCDMVHVIGTTRNHQRDKDGVTCDRFRVLLKPERRIISNAEYKETVRELAKKYPVDKSCLEGARHWFPCREIVSVAADGYLVDVIEAKPVISRARSSKRGGPVRQRSYVMLRRVMPVGKKNDLCFTIAKDLYAAGYGPDDIYDAIVTSPTYGGKVTAKLSEEIWTCVRNGIRSVEKGLAHG